MVSVLFWTFLDNEVMELVSRSLSFVFQGLSTEFIAPSVREIALGGYGIALPEILRWGWTLSDIFAVQSSVVIGGALWVENGPRRGGRSSKVNKDCRK